MKPYRRPSAASCASAIVPAGQTVLPGQIPQTRQTSTEFVPATVINGPIGLVGVMPPSYPRPIEFTGEGNDAVWWAFRLSQQTDRPGFVAWTNGPTVISRARQLLAEKIRRNERTFDGTPVVGVLLEPTIPKIDTDMLRRMWVWLKQSQTDGYGVTSTTLDVVARCAQNRRVEDGLIVAMLLTAFHTGGPTGGSEMQVLRPDDLIVYAAPGFLPSWDFPLFGVGTTVMDRAVLLPLQYVPASGISQIEAWRTSRAPELPPPPPVPSTWRPVSAPPTPVQQPVQQPVQRLPTPPGADPWRVEFQPFYDPNFTGKPPVAPTLPETPRAPGSTAPSAPAPAHGGAAPAPAPPAPTSPVPSLSGQRGIVLSASATEVGREWYPYLIAGSITVLAVGAGYYLYKRSQRGGGPGFGEF